MNTYRKQQLRMLAAIVIGGMLLAGGCTEGSAQAEKQDHGEEHEGHGDEHPDHGDEHEGHGEHEESSGHSEHDEHGGRGVEIPAESLESYDIEISQLGTGRLASMVEAPAKVRHNVERVAHITPLVKGQISKLYVSLGDTVEPGQTVAQMRSVELGNARAEVKRTEAMVDVAESNFQRQEKLKNLEIASERAFIEARGKLKEAKARHNAARAKLATFGVRGGHGPTYPLRSKVGGTVIEQHASLGETKGSNDALFVVADQSKIWVIGQVPEKSIHEVDKGMEAVVTLDAYPDRSWKGKVTWLSSTVDEKTRALPVRVALDNPKNKLKPGMFGTLRLKPSSTRDPLPLAPVDAVQKVHGNDVLFLPGEKEGHFRAQQVELGAESGGLVEVTSGIDAETDVVTSGAFDLKAALTAKGRSAAHHH